MKCGNELARFACRRMFLRIHSKKRQALSVVDVKTMACPAIPKRRRKSSVSATFCLIPLPKIGEGLGSGLKSSLGQGGLGGCDPQPQAANVN